ncbi:hypothetical protein ASG82_16515 [Mycobacterium sp. Soil538]|nr:hypothetical protein ASG82_16515 [Mycobacterium sp. Soil538]
MGAGYLLGRTKKMKWALGLASAGLTGKFPSHPTDLVAYGLKSLNTSGELNQLTEQIRGELLNAGRAAAIAAAVSRVDALNNRLQGVTAAADQALDDVGGAVGDVGGSAGDAVGGVGGALNGVTGRRRRRGQARDDYAEDDYEDDANAAESAYEDEPLDVEEDAEDIDDPGDVADDDLDDDVADDEDEDSAEEPEPPVTRRRAARRPSAPTKSVRTPRRSAARSTTRQGR